MEFQYGSPGFTAEGAEPPASLKSGGFQPGYKPPAPYFTWFWTRVSQCITELQEAGISLDEAIAALTESSSTIGYDNTSSGIEADNVQAAIDELSGKIGGITGGIPIVAATSTDGVAYTATLDGLTELYDGFKIAIIPDVVSTSTSVTLDLNGFGAKKIRMTLPFSSGNSGSLPTITSWMGAGSPLTLMYHSKFDTWKTELQRQSANALYGVVPITCGGTGADNAEDARTNLGISTADGTVTSGNADYAEVGTWADGNPGDEDRIGYFVAVDNSTAGTTMVKATSTADVRGVTVAAPAFSGNCSTDKFDADTGALLKQYDFVAVMGLVSVIDNGTCTINGRCMPTDDGTAVPSTNNMGYQVIDRIDSTHILVAVEPGADMIQRIKDDVSNLMSKSTAVTLTTSGWTSGTDGRYYQTVSASGVTADTPVVHVDCALDGTDLDADAAVLDAWMNGPSGHNVSQGDGTVTFYSYDIPAVNIPVNVGVA